MRKETLGVAGVVVAIAAGILVPLALSAAAGAHSPLHAKAPVAECSPPVSGPVANSSPPCPQTLTANPSTRLIDGEKITVTGGGFTPGATVAVVECQSGAISELGCDISTLKTVTAGQTGGFVTEYVVARIIAPNGSPVDCASPDGCLLGAADISTSPFTEEIAIPLAFNPKVPPLPPLKLSGTLDLTGLANPKTGVAFISGTATCNRPADVQIYGQFTQRYKRFLFSSSFFSQVACTARRGHPGTVPWTAVVEPTTGTYAPGVASVQGDGEGYVGEGYQGGQGASFLFTGTVTLTKTTKTTPPPPPTTIP